MNCMLSLETRASMSLVHRVTTTQRDDLTLVLLCSKGVKAQSAGRETLCQGRLLWSNI